MRSRGQGAAARLPRLYLAAVGLLVGITITAARVGGSPEDPAEGSPPTPSPPEAVAPSGSGTVAPAPADAVGSEWTLTIDQDFTTPAAPGEFDRVYPGWAEYDGTRDTSGHGLYDSDRVVSVSDGVLRKTLHTEDGQPLVAAVTPVPHVQTYGRYEVRFRADALPGYKIAWLLWPDDDDWHDGELNFPEAYLDAGEEIHGFAHEIGPNPHVNAFIADTGQTLLEWHTAVIEWRPDSVTFALDGVEYRTTDPVAVPQVPMYWSLQTETKRVGPAADVSGTVSIDYVRAWAWTPPA
ncbi:family 16 glycosylhydrolase [Geodermatophilus sp. CPCC 205761]|uniref:family 16 glycosylhydrolase n=1 Tax=Geodermatophilus sp. CPCC 205761 TaxID=2936597 RepID=UPI003EE9B074